MYKFKALDVKLTEFTDERDWGQFHTLENLSKAISIESSELLENFLWEIPNTNRIKPKLIEELADIFIYTLMFADKIDVDLIEIALDKIETNRSKYPIETSKGNAKKYLDLT